MPTPIPCHCATINLDDPATAQHLDCTSAGIDIARVEVLRGGKRCVLVLSLSAYNWDPRVDLVRIGSPDVLKRLPLKFRPIGGLGD